MEPDFQGYATKVGLKCADGRTIMPDAFQHQDEMRVPLVWQHDHRDPENVLGHVILRNRDDGVWAEGYFNDTAKAKHARSLVVHEDITQMSIWANQLIERAKRVTHGVIKEVSLVLSGANPGALIDPITIRHSDDDLEELEDQAIITTGEPLVHSEDGPDAPAPPKPSSDEPSGKGDDDGETVLDVLDSMSEKQKTVVNFLVGEALEAGADESNDKKNNTAEHGDMTDEENADMAGHNVFEAAGPPADERIELSHADMTGILEDAKERGSVKKAVHAWAKDNLEHGIDNIDILFPDAQSVQEQPDLLRRRTEWVDKFLGGARKSPFARIKTMAFDLTEDEARAKGYITGNVKTEEFVNATKRTTEPTTVYKKQKLDRDDMLDIADFDVVAFLKGEMRLMLDEEIARAGLLSDGRSAMHDDKVNETHIRPIVTDDDLFAIKVDVNISDVDSSVQEIIDAIVMNRRYYKGTGMPTMFTTETLISQFLLLKDTLGRRIYASLAELAGELRVSEIVAVEPMEDSDSLLAIIVNPSDYTYGAVAGGQVSMFDDFDIDYNQQKYLIETRTCGALTKLKSALVIRSVAGTDTMASPATPAFDGEDVVITNTTGVTYKDQDDNTLTNGGGPYTLAAGEELIVTATADSGYYFANSEGTEWRFVNRATS